MNRFLIIIYSCFIGLGFAACTSSDASAPIIEFNPSPTYTTQPTIVLPSVTATLTPSPHPTKTEMPTPLSESQELISCSRKTGDIESKQLETNWLPMPLEYRVYTPPCYNFYTEKHYPVLYLFHGYGFNDDQWFRLGATEIMDKLINTGKIHPFIVVMPYERDDITQPPENQFDEAFLDDLVKNIDSSYRSLPSREYRAIGGLSRGGNWAIHIGLTNWSLFGAIGAHSTPLFISDNALKVQGWLEAIPPDEYPRIYLDVGDKDKWLEHVIRLEELLDSFSVPHELFIFPGGHTETYWEAHTEMYIRWYAKDWQ